MPRSKRQKVKGLHEIALECWEHYRNYLDSLDADDDDDDNGGDGDVDELQEILELLKDHPIPTTSKLSYGMEYKTIVDMLPLLVSVVYYHLAGLAIAKSLQAGDVEDAANDDDADVIANAHHQQIESLLIQSLQSFPTNSATWSMGANYGRMTQRLSQSNILLWYRQAAHTALEMRDVALNYLLVDSDYEEQFKEWIELLLLNQVTGVEYEPNEKFDDEEPEDKNTDDDNGEIYDVSESDGHYSASAVESMARFMWAMLASMQGDHDAAASCLQHFGFTHRLHPHAWTVATKTNSTPVEKVPTKPPLMFCPTNGILPESLYQSMKQVFAPQAAYWKESNYMGRGYYSYFVEYEPNQAPRNLIEDVIIHHLLPRAKQVLPKEEGDRICGFEWWTHTRPIQANLGHNLHFDTDEALLAQKKEITHPILSSVLYLTGGSSSMGPGSPGGATIILDQVSDALHEAKQGWHGIPVNNALLLFPGNLLHGVLPCPGIVSADDAVQEINSNVVPSVLWNDWQSPPNSNPSQLDHRLTFMVGFWTRNVPSKMKEQHLYGPCGPLPPATADHSWVMEINQGYDQDTTSSTSTPKEPSLPYVAPTALPRFAPAWQRLAYPRQHDKDDQLLKVPHSIDHRFFVKGPDHCFFDSLFENHDGGTTPSH